MSNSWSRAEHLKDLADTDELDVLVIGGGVIGAGSTLDAATRGLRVGLVEMSDFASGTSSRSTKLFHGGIRYLPHFEFGLVHEGLAEQKILARTADFLYDPLEFLIPMYRGRRLADLPSWASAPRLAPLAMRIGLLLYDTLGRRPRGSHRAVSRNELLASVPTLLTDGLNGGFGYMDAQTDDSRLVLTVIKTAVERYKALAVNHLIATRIEQRGSGYLVHVSDQLSDATFAIKTRSVIAATGALKPPPAGNAEAADVRLSAGAHLIMNKAEIGLGDEALLLPETDDGRVMFVVPWLDTAMVGTTDTPYTENPAHPRATDDDVAYLMRHLRMYLDVGDIEPISAFSGLRALMDDGGSTAEASRGHEVINVSPGYVQVAGGKLTTYRRIAQETVDVVAKYLNAGASSRTNVELLVGAAVGAHAHDIVSGQLSDLGVDSAHSRNLLRRYGARAQEIVSTIKEDRRLGISLSDATTVLAEVRYAANSEGAATIGDFALRRTHAAWFSRNHARDDAKLIADELAAALGWSDRETANQLDAFETELIVEGL